MKRVLFVSEAGESACTEIRAQLPAEGLRLFGYDVDIASVMFENADRMLYGWDKEQLPRPHILVVRHTTGPEGEPWDTAEMYMRARRQGQFIFFDLDDDMWNIPDWNPAAEWMTPEVIKLVERNINACDGLIVSTPAIAKEAANHVDVPIRVALNGVPSRPHYRGSEGTPLRLGWFGATNWRRSDLEIVVEALHKELAGRYGKVEFWHLGYQESQPSIRTILGEDFPVSIVEYPWVPLRLIPWTLSMIDCAIIPQASHPFSEARSNITGLRMSGNGVCWAATATAEYERLFVAGAGSLVHDPIDWDRAIRLLCEPEHECARIDMRTGGYAVAKARDAEWMASQYVKIFSEATW